MRTGTLLALIVGIAALCLAGCGGGGGQATPPPGPQDTSSIEGEVDIQGAAADYELLLDGQPVPGVLRDDGSYEIPNVPPGQHRVAVIARNGMAGGYATVDVPESRRARAPRIAPEVGGQIVGIVTLIEEGVAKPLAGVEVTAIPAVMIMQSEQSGAGTPDGNAPSIYPPPDDLPTFNGFTDEDGSYVLRAVPPGEYTVSVAKPDMENGWKWVRVQAGRTAVADFQLRRAIEPRVGTVEGRVMGTQDGLTAPVAGARVTIMPETPWMPIGPPEIPAELEPRDEGEGQSEPGDPGDGDAPDADAIAPPWYDALSTVTNADGQFSLNAPSGYATIQVYMPGWDPVSQQIRILSGETLVLDFELRQFEDWPPPPPDPGPVPAPGDEEPPPPPDLGDDEPPGPPDLDGDRPPTPPLGDLR